MHPVILTNSFRSSAHHFLSPLSSPPLAPQTSSPPSLYPYPLALPPLPPSLPQSSTSQMASCLNGRACTSAATGGDTAFSTPFPSNPFLHHPPSPLTPSSHRPLHTTDSPRASMSQSASCPTGAPAPAPAAAAPPLSVPPHPCSFPPLGSCAGIPRGALYPPSSGYARLFITRR